MTNEDIDDIERALAIQLPLDYRKAAVTDIFKHTIYHDPNSIVRVNQSYRAGEFGDKDWPMDLFAFGHDGAGNDYCIRLDPPNYPVFLRDHETLEIHPDRKAFAHWLDHYVKTGKTYE
ncbi:SMI1/KNR4 family protein [Candidatus Sumerlaeota bacterium]|nr:SMI1/KNR4 family protein [Candidatus Sumerlaeota bacterium]